MNLAQSLAAAAAALMMGLSAGGVAPAQVLTQIAAGASAQLESAELRAAIEDLAAAFEERARLRLIHAQIAREAPQATASSDIERGRLHAPSGDEALAKACDPPRRARLPLTI